MPLSYDLEKLKVSIDEPTFARAAKLYTDGRVRDILESPREYSATVDGSDSYRVSISVKDVYYSSCDCYLGQNDTLCKHRVALALAVLARETVDNALDLSQDNTVRSSGVVGSLTKEEKAAYKKRIGTIITRYIRSYDGPSRTWFAYQDTLSEGCNRLATIVREMPICPQAAELLVDMLMRLDNKLSSGGVDDSNGIVGNFIFACVDVLLEQAKEDSSYVTVFAKKVPRGDICFDWNEPLLRFPGMQ